MSTAENPFFTHVLANGGQRRLQRLCFNIGRFLDLLEGRACRPRHAPRIKSVFLEYALAFFGHKINDLQPFRPGAIAQRVQRRTPGFLMAAAVEYLGGLPVTALRRPAQQRDLFESTRLVPLPSVARGKQLDALKSRLFIFAFYVVDLEGEPPDLPIDLVKAGMFCNAAAPSAADHFAGFFLEARSR
jgi:hypothetical protein